MESPEKQFASKYKAMMEEFWRDPAKGKTDKEPPMIYQTEKKIESRKLEVYEDDYDS